MGVDKRWRATGKAGMKRGERYAMVPEEVMTSDSYRALPDWGKCVLFALACRYNGYNNGDLSLPYSEGRQLGISAQWKLYAGLRVLEKVSLAICTRRGRLERGTKVASLYAVTWRGIDKCENVQLDEGFSPCPIPSHAWVKWIKPDDWDQTVQSINRANRGRKNPVSIMGGNGRSTHDGAEGSDIAPSMVVKERTFSAPSMMDTSKNQGLGASAGSPDARIGKLIQLQPQLLDHDIARSVQGATPERVALIRARLADGWRP